MHRLALCAAQSCATLLLAGCGGSQAPASPSPTKVAVPAPLPAAADQTADSADELDQPTGSFLEAWPQISKRLADPDLRRIDELVEPSFGLYVFDNPGAMVVVTHHASFSAAFAGKEFQPVLGDCALRTDVQPQLSNDCETWTPAGCIHTPGAHVGLAQTSEWILRASGELSEDQIQQAVAELRLAEAQITEQVMNTKGDTRCYFGPLRGRFWLMAVDIVTPCSA